MTRRFAMMGLCAVVAAGLAACGGAAQERKAEEAPAAEAAPAAKKKGEPLSMREVVVPAEPEYIDGVDRGAQDAFRTGVVAISQTPPDYNTGIRSFEEAVRKDKGFLEAYFNLGMCYERTGRPLDAVQVYQRAADANPGNPDAEGYVGKVYLALAKRAKETGDQAKATEYEVKAKAIFDRIIAENPDNVTANNALALYWLYRGDRNTAEDFVKKVLMVQPRNVVALNTRGLINLMAGKLNIARWVFEEKALREDPNASDAWTNLGLTYLKMGKTPQAVTSFEKAVAADPDNFEARMNIAAIYLDFLHYQAALEQYDAALKLVPGEVEALIGSGSCLYGLQRPEEAIGRWNKALELNPNLYPLLARIGKLYESRLNDLPKAIEMYEKYVAAANPPPEDPIVARLPVLKQMNEQGGLLMPPEPTLEGEEGATPSTEGEVAPAPAPEAAPAPAPAPEAAPAPAPEPEPAPAPAPEAAPAEQPAAEPAAG